MQAVTTSVALAAMPLGAETITCVMQDGVLLQFAIDYNQFAPALNADEPPRQRRTIVRFGDAEFAASPFRLSDVRGFEAEDDTGSGTLFVLQPDGAAVLTRAVDDLRIDGTCTIGEGSQ